MTVRASTLKLLWGIIVAVTLAVGASAAPGDTLYDESFDTGACANLPSGWTTTNGLFSGRSTQTANSGGCSLFVNGGSVTLTGPIIDLSGIIGADLDMWIRQGSDSFSEDTDANEDLNVQYFNSSGVWQTLQVYAGGNRPVGTVFTLDETLPLDALHSGFRLRFDMPNGSGATYDFWHIDDILIVETGTLPPPPPSSNLAANTCDDFESGFGNWTTTVSSASGINTDTANSGTRSLYLRHQAVTTTSLPFNSGGVNELTVWVRRGADAFSENPDAGENLVIEYLNQSGTWIALETFQGSGTQGQIFNRTYALPSSAQYANFQVRFRLTNASGADFDYWHVDDVCFNGSGPDLAVSKDVVMEQDPIRGTANPLGIPGAWAIYSITVTNNGAGSFDAGSLTLGDAIDPSTILFTGDFDGAGSPFRFTDGSGANQSGLSLSYGGVADAGDGVVFRDSGAASVTPNGGFDPSVSSFELTLNGAMNGTGSGGTPTFTIEYRVQVR
ncbi:MAG: hypothetical protein AAGF20_11530 [Pseudomonadota bacterium]